MTIIGPNDPRAMSPDDPRLYRPKGDTLKAQIDDAVDFMVDNLTEQDYAELEAALNSEPPKDKNA